VPEEVENETPEGGIEPGTSDGKSPEDKVLDAVFGKEELPGEQQVIDPVVPDGATRMDEGENEPEEENGVQEEGPSKAEGFPEEPPQRPEEEESRHVRPWSPDEGVADDQPDGQLEEVQPSVPSAPRVRNGELKGMATIMGEARSPVLPYRLSPGQRLVTPPIVTHVAGAVRYAPLFAPHPFVPRIIFHPPAPPPSRALVLPMPSAVGSPYRLPTRPPHSRVSVVTTVHPSGPWPPAVDQRRKAAAPPMMMTAPQPGRAGRRGEEQHNDGGHYHHNAPNEVQFKNVLAPQEVDFSVGRIGR
ncbi:26S proteasome non-ATPase regulatory subunit 8, partial [Perkinsus olseni]